MILDPTECLRQNIRYRIEFHLFLPADRYFPSSCDIFTMCHDIVNMSDMSRHIPNNISASCISRRYIRYIGEIYNTGPWHIWPIRWPQGARQEHKPHMYCRGTQGHATDPIHLLAHTLLRTGFPGHHSPASKGH
jgi:hypothetical protein